jgi:hypothetical protein
MAARAGRPVRKRGVSRLNQYEEALYHSMDEVAKELTVTQNPRHRAILELYRKHVHLEGSGQFDKIVAPDMMGDHPHYRIFWGQTFEVDGKDEIIKFYNGIGEAVLWNTDEKIAVADWGFAAELTLHQLAPGRELKMLLVDVDNDDDYYHLQSRQAFFWPYDEQQRLVGEYIYEDPGTRKVEKVGKSQVVTSGRAAEIHRELLGRIGSAA